MPDFRTIAVFECNNDVYAAIGKSITYIQLLYCFPTPSEYFKSIEDKISEDKTYLEQYIIFENYEKYQEWFDVFGEITEELVKELLVEFEELSITLNRYFEDVELSKALYNAFPISSFESKFNDNFKNFPISE
jgi:hypothetical protein